MLMPFPCVVPAVLILLTGAIADPPPSAWTGLKVVTRYAQPIRVENRTVDDGSRFRVYTVESEDDGILTVASGEVRGWIWATDVIPLDKAIDFFSGELRSTPNNTPAYHWRGLVWREKGDLEKARADEVMSIYSRGMAGLASRDYAKALADFDASIALDPQFVLGYNDRAWLRATCPDVKFRDGKIALESATKACEITGWKNPGYLDTLAAAHAEQGAFAKAVEWQQKAIDAGKDHPERQDFAARLALYRSNKPYRQE